MRARNTPGARGHYDRRRAAGDTHNAALRNLADKLLGKLWHCLHHNIVYDETTAWPSAADDPQHTTA